MKLLKYLKRQLFKFAIFALVLTAIGPSTPPSVAVANELEGSYVKTFTISAYYSPLPCQEKYATGDYKSDIRLNGNGTNGADGTPVYPGMVAAPSSYAFGTKMFIPGIGTVAIHDRGGAIIEHDGENGVYDRLDIWMGYGDIGLQRALNWGKRNVDVTVYGVNSAIQEEIGLMGFSQSESIPNECTYEEPRPPEIYDATDHVATEAPLEEKAQAVDVELSDPLSTTLQYGDQGSAVLALQPELNSINFYKGELNSYYDELTRHAVYKFQQSQGILGSAEELGAGVFGPRTKDKLNEIISSRNYTNVLVATTTQEKSNDEVMIATAETSAELTEEEQGIEIHLDAPLDLELGDTDVDDSVEYMAAELDFGMAGADVRKLQEFLKGQGYFQGSLTTDYFGETTQGALLAFQLDKSIISNTTDLGAGRVGPSTLATINSYF